jgi:kinesin family protein 1
MMGYGEAKGIIPIACERIFDRIKSNEDGSLTIKVQCSMLEIYMEKVRDLFNPAAGNLAVRMDPKIGFYVQDLTMSSVTSYEQISAVRVCGVHARAWHAC